MTKLFQNTEKTAKRGRPARPNMVKKLIKIDVALHARLSLAAKKEDTTMAAIISRALKKELT